MNQEAADQSGPEKSGAFPGCCEDAAERMGGSCTMMEEMMARCGPIMKEMMAAFAAKPDAEAPRTKGEPAPPCFAEL